MDAATEMRSNGGKARNKVEPSTSPEDRRTGGQHHADILTSEERRASAELQHAPLASILRRESHKLAAKQERERKKKRRKAA